MANRWYCPGSWNWSDATNAWSATTSPRTGGASAPGATNGQADIAIFDANSGTGTCTVDASVPTGDTALAGLSLVGAGASLFGGTLAFGANSIDIDGDCDLAGTITASAGSLDVSGGFAKAAGMTAIPSTLAILLNPGGGVDVTCNSVLGGTFTATPAAGQLIAQTDKFLASSFTLTAETWNGATFGMDVAGSIVRSGGTWSNSGTVTQTASGNISLTDSVTQIEHLNIAGTGVTSTIINHSYADRITRGAGTVVGAALFDKASSRTLNCDILALRPTANAAVGYISGATLATGVICGATGFTVTQTDEWDLGTKSLVLSDGTFNQARYRITAGNVRMTSGTTWSNPGLIFDANISDLNTSDITWAPQCSDLGGNSSYVQFGRQPAGPTTTGVSTAA